MQFSRDPLRRVVGMAFAFSSSRTLVRPCNPPYSSLSLRFALSSATMINVMRHVEYLSFCFTALVQLHETVTVASAVVVLPGLS